MLLTCPEPADYAPDCCQLPLSQTLGMHLAAKVLLFAKPDAAILSPLGRQIESWLSFVSG
jgi:hypothetical protein